MEQRDSLLSAINDVTSVAAELREVKKRAEQYGQATSRLQEVTMALGTLTDAVTDIQGHFQALLSKADEIGEHLEKSRLATESTATSIPAIVARIEATDVSKSVAAFSRSLDTVNDQFSIQLAAIEQIQSSVTEEREDRKRASEAIDQSAATLRTNLDRVMSAILTLQLASESHSGQSSQALLQMEGLHLTVEKHSAMLAESRSASEKSASASTVYGHKALKAVGDLSSKIESLEATLNAQNKVLTALAAKKGFLF